MQFLRSLLFTILLFLVTLIFGVIVLIYAMLPLTIHQRYAVPRGWAHTLLWLLEKICGLDYTVEGQENIPSEPFISMWKHSSAWETMAQMILVPTASWSLKREILWIPIVGWAVKTYKPIAIDRSAGGAAVKQLVAQGRERFEDGMGVVFYPEGTRVAPGETRRYGISGALLATETGRLVVPIAHNSGYFWRRRGIMKRPGTVRVVIGPPIDPTGLHAREINDKAQAWIESTIARIVAEPGGAPKD